MPCCPARHDFVIRTDHLNWPDAGTHPLELKKADGAMDGPSDAVIPPTSRIRVPSTAGESSSHGQLIDPRFCAWDAIMAIRRGNVLT